MRKSVLFAVMLGACVFTSCGSMGGVPTGATTSTTPTTGTSGASSAAGTALTSLLSGLLGSSSQLSQADLLGTWNYSAADCVFETENLLLKAGGEMAAAKLESQLETQLAKVGIKKGSCSYTFNNDGTYTAVIGGYNLNGTYTLNTGSKTVKLTYLAGMGSITPHVVKNGNSISLLYESDKLLAMVQKLGALSKNSTVSGLTSLLGSYDGLLVGMQLTK